MKQLTKLCNSLILRRSTSTTSASRSFIGYGASKQRGVALISVMLIIALCVIIASQLVQEQRLQIERSSNLFDRKQAFQYARSSERFVASLLAKTLKDNDGQTNLDQDWAKTGMSFPVSNGVIEGQIKDLSTCLNVNAMWQPDMEEPDRIEMRAIFVRLMEAIELKGELSHEDLANNIYDWLDEDDYPIEAVGYDGDSYASLDFPYLSANSPLVEVNELRVINGFDVVTYEATKDVLCALPQHRDLVININTLDSEKPEYLMAVLDVDKSTAQDIIAERPDDGYKDIADFWESAKVKALKNITPKVKSYFTVSSKFFKLVTNASYNDANFALTSLIQIDNNYRSAIIGRRFGGEVEREANPEDEQPKD